MAAEIHAIPANKSALAFDAWLIVAVALLICVGLVMVTSSSIAIAQKQFELPLYYLWRSVEYLVIGSIIAIIVYRIPMIKWMHWSPAFLVINIMLLAMVLWVGKEVNGSTRWLCYQNQCLQVSEITKFALIMYVAGYLVRHEDRIKQSLLALWSPFFILGLIAVLLLLEPDFGALTVMVLTMAAMVLLGGVNIKKYIMVVTGLLASMATFLYLSSYHLERLTSFLHPCAPENAFGNGYQLCQALIAFGQGGLFGVGLGSSVQKLFYLPEAHTDFIFAVMGEELGLVGVLFVVTLYCIVIYRAYHIARIAESRVFKFSAYCAFGLGFWIAIQALISMGVNTGLLPTKGLTLPFISYGGSNFIMMLISVAVLLRIDLENHQSPKTKKAVAWRVAS